MAGSVLIGLERRGDNREGVPCIVFGDDEKAARGWKQDPDARVPRRLLWVKVGSPGHKTAQAGGKPTRGKVAAASTDSVE